MGGRAIIYYETQYKTDPEAATRICPSIAAPEARELCESELQYTIDAYASIE
jgi:hypothetical protein